MVGHGIGGILGRLRTKRALQEGLAHLRAGRHSDAIAALSAEIARSGASAVASYARAQAYIATGRSAEALADLDRAIALDPAAVAPHRTRGLLRRKLGQADAALADLDRAVALAPRDTAILQDRALFRPPLAPQAVGILVRLGRYLQEAITFLV